MKSRYSNAGFPPFKFLLLLIFCVGCGQPVASVILPAGNAATVLAKTVNIQFEIASPAGVATESFQLPLSAENLGKLSSYSFPSRNFDEIENVYVSVCHVGPMHLDGILGKSKSTDSDVIALRVVFVKAGSREHLLSKIVFANYKVQDVVAFDERGVKITLTP